MSKDIEDFNSSCAVCKSYRPDQQKEPIISHEIPTGPWEKVACDLFDFERFVWTTTLTTSKLTEFMTRNEGKYSQSLGASFLDMGYLFNCSVTMGPLLTRRSSRDLRISCHFQQFSKFPFFCGIFFYH